MRELDADLALRDVDELDGAVLEAGEEDLGFLAGGEAVRDDLHLLDLRLAHGELVRRLVRARRVERAEPERAAAVGEDEEAVFFVVDGAHEVRLEGDDAAHLVRRVAEDDEVRVPLLEEHDRVVFEEAVLEVELDLVLLLDLDEVLLAVVALEFRLEAELLDGERVHRALVHEAQRGHAPDLQVLRRHGDEQVAAALVDDVVAGAREARAARDDLGAQGPVARALQVDDVDEFGSGRHDA